MTILAVLAMMTVPAPDPPMRLTFIHGDEYLASWLEASTPRRGDLVRARVMRVRKGVQPYWLVLEIDCAASAIANIAARTIAPEDAAAPPFEGPGAAPLPFRAYYRFERALKAAVCDGRYDYPDAPQLTNVEAAMAAALSLGEQAVRARPMELIAVRVGSTRVLVDRATLDGGGPQWEVRSVTVGRHGRPGVWSWWEVDCDRWRRTADLHWSAPVHGERGYGARTMDNAPAARAAPGTVESAVLETACAPDIWRRPASGSFAEALAD